MKTGPEALSAREQIEAELAQLRQQLAEAWWYERPLETIQEIERLITACTRELSEQSRTVTS